MLHGLSTSGLVSPIRSNNRLVNKVNQYRIVDTGFNERYSFVDKNGAIAFPNTSDHDGIASLPCIRSCRTTSTGVPAASMRVGTNEFFYFYTYQNDRSFRITNSSVSVGTGGAYAWGNVGNPFGTPVTSLISPLANVIEHRNTVTPTTGQDLRIFNTYTNRGSGVTNLEFLSIKGVTNIFRIQSFKGSAGGTARAIEFAIGGTDTNGTMTEGTTVLTIGTDFHLTVRDGSDINLGSTTGTKIGTATTQKIGFYNSTPITKPEVTGVRSDGTALTNLLTTLSTLGLITNSTTA